MKTKFQFPERLFRPLSAAIVLSVLPLLASAPLSAERPEQAIIEQIEGNSSQLRVRRGGNQAPAATGTELQRTRDALITVDPNDAHATLRFRSANGNDLNFYVNTHPHAEEAIYYFPCEVQGGNFHIGWGLARDAARGCENGVTHNYSGSTTAILPPEALALGHKQIAQTPVRRIAYCLAADSVGNHGLATATNIDPCEEAIAQCEANGGNCDITSTGFWWSSEPELEASLSCDDGTTQQVTATGEGLEAALTELVAQAAGANCSAQVGRTEDLVIAPAPDEVVLEQGSDDTLVQTRSTDAGLEVDVVRGAVTLGTSNDDAPEILRQGQRYTHTGSTGQVTTFDREAALTSIEMEVLCAMASNSEDPIRIGACEEGLGIDTTAGVPVAFCNREQASGGQEGDRRIVQMTAKQGEVQLSYEMFTVTDRLQVFQDGVQILDTGFVSGRDSVTVPLNGRSGRLEVVVTGNPGPGGSGTRWNYLLACP